MVWTGISWVDEAVCQTCYQPECSKSAAGLGRPEAGLSPQVLTPGQRAYRGYCEWVVHPDEARVILHRGYAIVDGQRVTVRFVHNEAFVTQLRVDNSDLTYVLTEKFQDGPQEARVTA